MLSLTRLQLLFCAYAVLVGVGTYEFISDLLSTGNFLQSWLNSFSNPVNLCLLPVAFLVGYLIAQELDA